MSNQNQDSNSNFQSYSYSSSSFTSSSSGQPSQKWSHTETTRSDNHGTTIDRTSEEPGKPRTQERIMLNAEGRPILEGGGQTGQGRIGEAHDSDETREKEKQYEERMEEEYAKREGGA